MSKKPKQTKCHPFSFCQNHWLTCNLVTRSLKHANVPSDPCALSKFSGLITVSPFSQTERQPRVSLPVAPLVAWPCSSLTRSLWTGLRHHPSFRPRLRLTCSLLRISLVAAGSELVSTRPQRLLSLWHPIPSFQGFSNLALSGNVLKHVRGTAEPRPVERDFWKGLARVSSKRHPGESDGPGRSSLRRAQFGVV